MTHKLTFTGKCPTKKNSKHAWKGRVVIDPEIRERLEALLWQAREQWCGKAPIETVESIRAWFYVPHYRADMDGKFTTLLDILTKARVIRNDNMACVRHTEQFGARDPNERSVVEISTPEAGLVL